MGAAPSFIWPSNVVNEVSRYRLHGVLVRASAWSAGGPGFKTPRGRVIPKTYKMVQTASQLGAQQYGKEFGKYCAVHWRRAHRQETVKSLHVTEIGLSSDSEWPHWLGILVSHRLYLLTFTLGMNRRDLMLLLKLFFKKITFTLLEN